MPLKRYCAADATLYPPKHSCTPNRTWYHYTHSDVSWQSPTVALPCTDFPQQAVFLRPVLPASVFKGVEPMPPAPGDVDLPAQLAQWIAAAQQGSQEALGQALEACRQYLLLIANRHLDPELRAKVGPSDVVQETFLKAQREFVRFHGSTEQELLAWLKAILLNNLANVVRDYRATDKRQLAREVPLAEVPDEELLSSALAQTETPSGQMTAREQADEVDRALAQLPEPYRQVIALRNEERLSFEEIGQRLGRSAEAARKLWARAIEALQQLLEPPGEER